MFWFTIFVANSNRYRLILVASFCLGIQIVWKDCSFGKDDGCLWPWPLKISAHRLCGEKISTILYNFLKIRVFFSCVFIWLFLKRLLATHTNSSYIHEFYIYWSTFCYIYLFFNFLLDLYLEQNTWTKHMFEQKKYKY
jgi:hypothetical protein